MRIGVIADIHGNFEALKAVTKDMSGRAVDRTLCLGDNVGYGPDPEAVVRHLEENGFDSVCGNHEFALFDERGRRWLNFQAAENCLQTRRLMSDNSLQYLRKMPIRLRVGAGHFVHGFPPESLFLYLNRQKPERILKLFAENSPEIYFVGHTHRLEMVVGADDWIERRALTEEVINLGSGQHHIFGCGSTGQPRDGDGRSVYLIWDQDQRTVEVVRVSYDYEKTREKIRELGFPEIYGLRLGGKGMKT